MTALVWTLAAVAVIAAVWSIVSALRASGKGRSPASTLGDDAEDGGRIPLREEPLPVGAAPDLAADPNRPASVLSDSLHGEPVQEWTVQQMRTLLEDGNEERKPDWPRRVMTPNGPMDLTAPPFRLRHSIMSWRERAYARAITARMPSGYVLCPQLRLDSLLVPTKPGDRSADDWRTWRQRVRIRAVDFVVCRLPDWAPVLAIEVDLGNRTATEDTNDKMTLETLAEVGLPLVRCSGSPEKDWPMIEPYVPEFDEDEAFPMNEHGAPDHDEDADRPAESA
ncbi:MAG: DUF2726 domain-containing protein [Phycisphaerales bacterium]